VKVRTSRAGLAIWTDFESGGSGQFSGGIGTPSRSRCCSTALRAQQFRATGNRCGRDPRRPVHAQIYRCRTPTDTRSRRVAHGAGHVRSATQYRPASSEFSTHRHGGVDYGWRFRVPVRAVRWPGPFDLPPTRRQPVDNGLGATRRTNSRRPLRRAGVEYVYTAPSSTLRCAVGPRRATADCSHAGPPRVNSATRCVQRRRFYTVNYDYCYSRSRSCSVLINADRRYATASAPDRDPPFSVLAAAESVRVSTRAARPEDSFGNPYADTARREPVRAAVADAEKSATARSACSSTPATCSPRTTQFRRHDGVTPVEYISGLTRSGTRPAWPCSGSRRSAYSGSATLPAQCQGR